MANIPFGATPIPAAYSPQALSNNKLPELTRSLTADKTQKTAQQITPEENSSSVQSGVLGGEKFALVLDPREALTEAAEEMSMLVAETVEEDTSKTEEKSERAMKGNVQEGIPELFTVDKLESMLLKLFNKNEQGKLQELVKQMVQSKGNPLEWAAKSFQDVTKQFAFLQAILVSAEVAGNTALKQSVQAAITQLKEAHGPAILAGLNTLEAANAFSDKSKAQDRFRATYRDAVLAATSLRDMLQKILEKFGDKNFEKGFPLLSKALGEDLASLAPSQDPVRLHAILSDLYLLETALTSFIRARTACKRFCRGKCRSPEKCKLKGACQRFVFEKQGNQQNKKEKGQDQAREDQQENEDAAVSPTDLMTSLLQLTDGYVGIKICKDIAVQFNVVETPSRIALFTTALDMLRNLPVKIWPPSEANVEESTRDSALSTLQFVLDREILKE